MSDLNATQNRAVWFDIPVGDLDRAAAFYATVLAIKVDKIAAGPTTFCVLEHDQGNGGCLVQADANAVPGAGVLLYLNAEGRIATPCVALLRSAARSSRTRSSSSS